MATRDLKRIQKEAEHLSPAEQLQLAEFLLGRAHRTEPQTGDPNAFSGTIKLGIDPLEYQRQIRSEWH